MHGNVNYAAFFLLANNREACIFKSTLKISLYTIYLQIKSHIEVPISSLEEMKLINKENDIKQEPCPLKREAVRVKQRTTNDSQTLSTWEAR